MIRGSIHTSDGRCLLPRAKRTRNALERMRGLLGRRELAPDEALLIDPCASVHTLGMRFSVDLAFLDGAGVTRRLVPCLGPWRMAACRGARMTLEMPAGSIERLGIRTGDALRWQARPAANDRQEVA